MLDAFIIDKIHRDREKRDSDQGVVRIEAPRDEVFEPFGPRPELEDPEDGDPTRGVTIIDYSV